jgi:hypothetical protein
MGRRDTSCGLCKRKNKEVGTGSGKCRGSQRYRGNEPLFLSLLVAIDYSTSVSEKMRDERGEEKEREGANLPKVFLPLP